MPNLKPDPVYRESHIPLETPGKYFSQCCYRSVHNSKHVEGKVWSGTGHLYTNSTFVYLEHNTWKLMVRIKKKVKWSRYRPGVAQRVGRGIALLFHDRGTRKGWVVSSTPRTYFTLGKEPVPILQEAVWALGSVCTGGKSSPHRDSIPDRPARSQSLYRLSYLAHNGEN